ncbi:MAG: type VI secretion system tip protein VgrG [Myxococcales bacterium]|nr:type VI secretion system tip protein VgrG [Myxococcales bacterium]
MTSLSFASAAFADHPFLVAAMHGREALNQPFRFELEVVSPDPDLDLDALLGGSAALQVGDRVVRAVIAEVAQGARVAQGYAYHLVLVPRLGVLAMGKMSRVYHDLSVPEIVDAVLRGTGAGVSLEPRLERRYDKRASVMQFGESPLAFISRLLEDEGIAAFTESDADGERLVLADGEGAYRHRIAAFMSGATSGGISVVELESFGCRRQLVPRHLLLQDHDPDQPDLPLSAMVEVDERGFGVDVTHGAGFQAPERGAKLARLRAEALRSAARSYQGATRHPLAAGMRLTVAGHFRADHDGDYLVTAVCHRADVSGYRCEIEARPMATPFRPALTTPRPRVDGVVPARVDALGPDELRACDAAGRYRVVLPFDVSGAGEGRGSSPVPLLSPDEGTRFNLRRGAPVVLSFLGGDPDRPVISGAVPARREAGAPATNVIRTPQGGIIEMSGRFAKNAEGASRQVEGALPREQHHSNDQDWTHTNDDASDNDWVRFAVPHDRGWSYLRYGAQTRTPVSAGSGENTVTEFTETTYVDREHVFHSKFIDDDGESVSGGDVGYEWNWASIDDSAYHTNFASSSNSKGGESFFGHDDSYGVYDYTDGNRTTITQGTHQSLTVGHRTDVILGDYRLIIPKRTNGVYDADVYGMRYRQQAGHWRKTEWSHVASDTYSWGDTESFFWGFNFDLSGGVAMSGFLGGKLEGTAALAASFNFGAALEVSAGDKFVYTMGDERKRSTSHLINAENTITMAIGNQSWESSGWDIAFAAGAGVLGAAALVGTSVNFDDDHPETSLIFSGVTGALALAAAAALAFDLLFDDAKNPEGFPRIIMDKDDGFTLEASADNRMIFTPDGFFLRVGESVIDINSTGIFLKSGGGGAVLLDGSGGAAVTVDGGALDASSAASDVTLPAMMVKPTLAALAFNSSNGVGIDASGVVIVE